MAAACVWRGARHLELGLLLAENLLLLPLAVAALSGGHSPRAALSQASFRLLLAAALACFVLASGIAIGFKLPAQTGDESAYRFQAGILSTGRLAAEAPPRTSADEESYQRDYRVHHHVIYGGK